MKNSDGLTFHDSPEVYEFALMWYFTGKQAYADAVVRILDDWASTNTGIYYGRGIPATVMESMEPSGVYIYRSGKGLRRRLLFR